MAIGALALGAALSPSAAVAAFPGGNGLIAFSGSPSYPDPFSGSPSFNPEPDRGIFTIRPDGSGLHQVTDDAGGSDRDREPSWSADGRRLVFIHSVYTGEADDYAVLTIDAEGGDRTLVVHIGKSLVSPAPSFSPSGRRIIYTVFRPPPPRPLRGSIRVIRPDGTKSRGLLRGYFEQPQYSPSGKRIVFAGLPKGKNRSGIWDMRRDGSGLRRLTDPKKIDSELSDLAPDYSPDGRQIIFARAEYYCCGVGIRVMRADGSRERSVSGAADVTDWAEAYEPVFAPAGDRIAMPRVIGSAKYGPVCSDIYTMSPTGSDRQKITNACLGPPYDYGLGGVVLDPSWQPDPPSTFSFGTLKQNKKRGSAKLTVKFPGPGELELANTKRVKGTQRSAASEGTVKLPIKPRRKAKKQLRRKGEAKVKAKVTYTPAGGPPNTQSRKVWLKKKR